MRRRALSFFVVFAIGAALGFVAAGGKARSLRAPGRTEAAVSVPNGDGTQHRHRLSVRRVVRLGGSAVAHTDHPGSGIAPDEWVVEVEGNWFLLGPPD